MPELPDITVYVEALNARLCGETLRKVRIRSPFVVRTVEPAISALEQRPVKAVTSIGKRIVVGFEQDLFAVIHLMIAGRLWWRKRDAVIPKGRGLAAFDFDTGTLLLTEASKKKRASIHTVAGSAALAAFDRGGIDVLGASYPSFVTALLRENHTLKRCLTDPSIFSGIGNAYSDEILFAAGLSPFKQTRSLSDEEKHRLYTATVSTLTEWIDRLRSTLRGKFPEKVTAFHVDMAVHGKFRDPCPVCGSPVQRIVYAEGESNYCAKCQTGGRLLADRALSRLLKQNWPKTLDELEQNP